MEILDQDVAAPETGERKRISWVLFGLLVLISALVGATSGLLLVYSTDLPQVEGLVKALACVKSVTFT